MKKTILNVLILFVITIWGCGNNSNTTNENKVDSIKTTQNNDIGGFTDLLNSSFNGNEPFWNIKFESDFAIFQSPADPEEGIKIYYKKKIGESNSIKLNEAINKISDKEAKIFGLMDKQNVEITIKIANCDDGMSPEKYNRKIFLLRNNMDKYEGCGKFK